MTNQALYRAFCKDQEAWLPVFVQDWYLDAACTGGHWDAAIVTEENSNKVLAAMPYFLKKKIGLKYITMPLFVKMMGPYFAQQPDKPALTRQHELLEKLIASLPKGLVLFAQNFHYNASNWLPFYWAGYKQAGRYSYQLSLVNGLDSVWEGINRNMRRNITKAQSALTLVEDISLEDFWRIHQKSFERQGLRPPYSFEQLKRHHEALQAHQAGRMYGACDPQGVLHSVAYLIWDRHSAYYHLSGDDPALRQSGAGFWLIWEAIRYTHEILHLPVFDFEGSMLRPIEAIRRQFGAQQCPYSFVSRYFWPFG